MPYTLTIAVTPTGSGYTEPAVGSYSVGMGATVTVTAYPYSGYEFDYWEIDPGEYSRTYPAPSYMFAMPGGLSLLAHFRVAGTRPILGVRAGAEKIATAAMTNPTSKPYDYDATLFLGLAAVASSSKSFHLNAGESKDINFPITMPETYGIYPVYLSIMSGGQDLGLFRGEDDIVVAGISDLLVSYQEVLADAITKTERGDGDMWVYIPGYGLQYAYLAIDQLKELMIIEAISLGLISTSADAYFVRDVMYFSDGTTIVPYWWDCPYCAERFRSPEARDAHISEVHWDIINTKAVIIGTGAIPDPTYGPVYSDGVYVIWRNDSPFTITGRLTLCMTDVWGSCMVDLGYRDTLVGSGQSVRLDFISEFIGPMNFKATLTLVGEPLPGMLLDETLFSAGEEPEL